MDEAESELINQENNEQINQRKNDERSQSYSAPSASSQSASVTMEELRKMKQHIIEIDASSEPIQGKIPSLIRI